MLTAQDVKKAIMEWPSRYQTESGANFWGMPVSQIPAQLRSCGWKNVSRLDSRDLKRLGLHVTTARYVGGARPKRFCEVVVVQVGAYGVRNFDISPEGWKQW